MDTAQAPRQGVGQPMLDVHVMLYSHDRSARDAVRIGLGSRPSREVTVASWHECATPEAAVQAVERRRFDVLILDGESQPLGGMGLCRQLKNEIPDCPPVMVITGRPQDAWLAAWSLADAVAPRPIDPLQLTRAFLPLIGREGQAPFVARP